MRILILGGGGFIGSTVADRLLVEGHQVRIFERPRVAPYRQFRGDESVEWVSGDIANKHDLQSAVAGVDVAIHLISTTLPKDSNDNPIYDVQTNVVGTLQMLDAMVDAKVKKVVFISSGGTVYGRPQYLPIDEKHPTDPLVSYGITKLTIEKYLQLYQHLHGLPFTVLRVTNPYGARQRTETAQGAVSVFLHRALKNIPIEIWGDGSVVRDYIHISDVAEAFVKAVEYSGHHPCFNISSGTGLSLNELLAALEETIGRAIQRVHLPGRPFDTPTSILSNSLARNELHWRPSTSMREGLAATARWMKRELGDAGA